MKYCTNCVYKLAYGTEKFCPECSYKLAPSEERAINIGNTSGDVIAPGVTGKSSSKAILFTSLCCCFAPVQ